MDDRLCPFGSFRHRIRAEARRRAPNGLLLAAQPCYTAANVYTLHARQWIALSESDSWVGGAGVAPPRCCEQWVATSRQGTVNPCQSLE